VSKSPEKIDWVAGKPREVIHAHIEWREAVERADNGDTSQLTKLLRSNLEIGSEARAYIADLIERHNLRRGRGRPATPAYRVTAKEAEMNLAVALYRYHRKTMSEPEAIQQTMRERKREVLAEEGDTSARADLEIDGMIEPEATESLVNAIKGRRGSRRRMVKRRG
jgi:hypothetical protein